jgi:hypothetical protein
MILKNILALNSKSKIFLFLIIFKIFLIISTHFFKIVILNLIIAIFILYYLLIRISKIGMGCCNDNIYS